MIVSLDCMLLKSGIFYNYTTSMFYYKVISFGFLPAVLSLVSAMIWIVYYSMKNERERQGINVKQCIIVTSFIIIYFLYPTITNLSFSLFNCIELENGLSYLRRDLTIQCWTASHIRYSVLIGVPIIVVWVVGFPLLVFGKLFMARNDLNNKDIVVTYGLFYGGLNDDAYFWEIAASNIRKVVFIMCSTLLSTVNQTMKALIGLIIIMA